MLRLPAGFWLAVLGLLGAALAGCAGEVTSSGMGGTAGVSASAAGGVASAGGPNVGGMATGGSGVGGLGTGGAVLTGGATQSAGGTTAPATGGQPTGDPACPGLPYSPTSCVGTGSSAEPVGLDVYIMLDRTQSMAYPTQCEGNDVCIGTRWADLGAALQQFVSDPDVLAEDVRAGIQFFSQTGDYENPADCDPAVYAKPAVEIAPLAESGPQIMTAIGATLPSGETPSVPALQGAVQHAIEWQAQNPARQTIVLFITDGLPTTCDMTDAAFVAAAAAGMASNPPIRTYIIGVSMGANRFTLNAVARSGGSTQAYLVEGTNSSQALVAALKTVTANPLPCEYAIPAAPNPLQAIDYNLVQVVHTPATGPQEEVPYATRRSGCSAIRGGWYYDLVPSDDPNAPKPSKIILCPCTCANLSVGKLDIFYGCYPQVYFLN